MTQAGDLPVTTREGLAVSGPVFREFKGKLANIEFTVENGRPKGCLQFTEMDVIRSVAAYPHPTGEIKMNRTGQNGAKPSDRSPWGRLIIDSDEQGYPDLMSLIDQTLHMNAIENKIEANADRGTEAGSFISWEILSVNGEDNRPKDGDVPAADASGTAGGDDPK